MGANGHARFHLRADSILGHAIDGLTAHRRVRRVDHLWIYAGAYCFKHGLSGPFSGQIDRASAIEIERNSGLVRCNQSKNDLTDIAARQIMRLQRIARNVDARFYRGDSTIDNQAHRHLAQTHADHFSHPDRRIRDARPQPQSEKVEENDREDQPENGQNCHTDEIKSIHARNVTLRRGW